jgi:hypothetical protein
VEEAFMVGRHQLAVAPEHAGWTEVDERVVKRPWPLGFPLVDPDGAEEVALATDRDEAVDERAGNIDRVLPQALPQLVPPREPGRVARPSVRRVQRDEAFREYGELDASVGGLVE